MSRVLPVSHAAPPPSSSPIPPPVCGVPEFGPLRPGGRHRLLRALRRRRRAVAAGLAVTAAALAAAGPLGGAAHSDAAPPRAPGLTPRGSPVAAPLVETPVRITDAGAARTLHPGDRVEVLAAGDGPEPARVVVRVARVTSVPPESGAPAADGALVVLAVPRPAAKALAGAADARSLAVAKW